MCETNAAFADGNDIAYRGPLSDYLDMPEQNQSAKPRAFLSYSWSSPKHQDWVIQLATRLVDNGVDIKFDKWDLQPGHDSNQFMESMVTDPTVTKVLMICDKVYTEKADARSGGVGTESQIISPELYGKGTQDKFAALITELDDEGRVCVPVFYKGRIHFDFAVPERFEESYEQLLRWLHGRPQYVKPTLGSIPESILQATPVANATLSRAKRAGDAIRGGILGAPGLIREYGDALISEIRSCAPEQQSSQPFDETMLAAVETIRPYLRQFSELVTVAVRFGQNERVWDRILAIHEQLGALMFHPAEVGQWRSTDFDAFKIVAHDAFLTTIAIALSEERFDLADVAMRRGWLVNPSNGGHRRATSDYTVFNQGVHTLEQRNQRLKLNHISLHADLLREAHPAGGAPSFDALMQADFILFLRSVARPGFGRWYPFSLVYAMDRFHPFELFARAESKAKFSCLSRLLDAPSVEAFKRKIAEIQDSQRAREMFNFRGLAVAELANSQYVGTTD
jgi:hypothetical protein